MPDYIVRIQLEGADRDPSYNILHDAMKEKGFARSVKGEDGKFYDLPWAMYYMPSSLALKEVLRWAQMAANATGKSSMVLAIEAQNIEWNNLPATED